MFKVGDTVWIADEFKNQFSVMYGYNPDQAFTIKEVVRRGFNCFVYRTSIDNDTWGEACIR